MKDDNQHEVIETTIMAVPRGRGGRNIRGGHGGTSSMLKLQENGLCPRKLLFLAWFSKQSYSCV